MKFFLLPLLQIDVAEKIKQAPDSSYETGVIIGSYLPFLLFAGVALWLFFRAKNKGDREL
jgi:hypothetical protein